VGFYWRRRAGCERWLRTISLRLDGEVSELESAALDRHLASCARCREASAGTNVLTQLLREAPLVELDRPVFVAAPRRVRKRTVRRAAAGVLVAAGLAAAIAGSTAFRDSGPTHPSSALGFRDLDEQRRFVQSELIRLEPHLAAAAQAAPRLAGRGLL
jgi:anti-sigma factor RsiW